MVPLFYYKFWKIDLVNLLPAETRLQLVKRTTKITDVRVSFYYLLIAQTTPHIKISSKRTLFSNKSKRNLRILNARALLLTRLHSGVCWTTNDVETSCELKFLWHPFCWYHEFFRSNIPCIVPFEICASRWHLNWNSNRRWNITYSLDLD